VTISARGDFLQLCARDRRPAGTILLAPLLHLLLLSTTLKGLSTLAKSLKGGAVPEAMAAHYDLLVKLLARRADD